MPTTFFVKKFSAPEGLADMGVWESQFQALRQVCQHQKLLGNILIQGVAAEGLADEVDPSVEGFSSYNEPWTKENRRDEVMLRTMGGGPWGLF